MFIALYCVVGLLTLSYCELNNTSAAFFVAAESSFIPSISYTRWPATQPRFVAQLANKLIDRLDLGLGHTRTLLQNKDALIVIKARRPYNTL